MPPVRRAASSSYSRAREAPSTVRSVRDPWFAGTDGPMSGRRAALVLAIAALTLLTAPGTAAPSTERVRADGPTSPTCADATLIATPQNTTRVAAAIVCVINQKRAGAALYPVGENHNLDLASRFQSRDMVESHFLAHEAPHHPSLLNRLRDAGYFANVSDALFTENIGVAPADEATAQTIVDGWMTSEHHRVNILTPIYRDMGVGMAFAGPDPVFYADRNSVVFTTDFGRRWYKRHCLTHSHRASPSTRYCPRKRRRHR